MVGHRLKKKKVIINATNFKNTDLNVHSVFNCALRIKSEGTLNAQRMNCDYAPIKSLQDPIFCLKLPNVKQINEKV